MTIRKGNPEDMQAVLGLIQELAAFEKEPDAVCITVDDLVRDGFGSNPLFHVFVAEVNDSRNCRNRFILLSLFDLERENNSFRGFDCKG